MTCFILVYNMQLNYIRDISRLNEDNTCLLFIGWIVQEQHFSCRRFSFTHGNKWKSFYSSCHLCAFYLSRQCWCYLYLYTVMIKVSPVRRCQAHAFLLFSSSRSAASICFRKEKDSTDVDVMSCVQCLCQFFLERRYPNFSFLRLPEARGSRLSHFRTELNATSMLCRSHLALLPRSINDPDSRRDDSSFTSFQWLLNSQYLHNST